MGEGGNLFWKNDRLKEEKRRSRERNIGYTGQGFNPLTNNLTEEEKRIANSTKKATYERRSGNPEDRGLGGVSQTAKKAASPFHP